MKLPNLPNESSSTEEGLFLCDSNETSNGILSQTQLDKVFKDFPAAYAPTSFTLIKNLLAII